jgi:lipoic acid synthetase
MSVLPILETPRAVRRLPPWLKRRIPAAGDFAATDRVLADLQLETVCTEARCPNRGECWSRRTATFMVLGRVCTRPCGFCAVERGRPDPVAEDEPERVAEAAARLGLRHVVVTSVTRDDLPDGGARHFARCIHAVRARTSATVEVLTPDFDGRPELVDEVLAARPDVFNHNIETVARLQRRVRRSSSYRVSLEVLRRVKRRSPDVAVKSGVMLGLGETMSEVLDLFADLRSAGVEILTVGQYLSPSPKHLPVERFVPPEEFARLGRLAEGMGFAHVASAPFVRSSYHADEAWLLAAKSRASSFSQPSDRP